MSQSSGSGTQGSYSSEKITDAHLQRLAVIYVRQSTAQQVLEHGESTRLQYSLASRARALGWPEHRVLLIDEDLGKSGANAQDRAGFQRLVSEVSLDHVGIIIGVEISRLARSSKDWHQLLEICALFRTLIADSDGIYDPGGSYNDRLLLGLKGTMSEAELHVIEQRLQEGRLSKARRGELGKEVPTGYVRHPSGEVTFDPDEQVQHVIGLVFRKFSELGTLNAVLSYLVKYDVRIGIRLHEGPAKGELEWRRPNRSLLQSILKHPIYAGAYVYGRRQVDSRGKQSGRSCMQRINEPDQWHVLLKDQLPAYISWEQYEHNRQRLEANRARYDEVGTPREGSALLAGLVVCARCQRRMGVHYYRNQKQGHGYICGNMASDYGQQPCQSLSGKDLDEFVSQQALRALQPASLELSLQAAANLQRERDDLEQLWQQRLERAEYEASKAARRYHQVDPDNRLVARQLEREWETKLAAHKELEEDYHRFSAAHRRVLSDKEREEIRQLAEDIPALWEAPTTTAADRKEILRQLLDRVVIDVEGDSERVQVTFEWAGGMQTQGIAIRPVARLDQLSYYPQLCERVRTLSGEGYKAPAIADQLNAEGYRPPKRRKTFRAKGVQDLMRRLGITQRRPRSESREGLGEQEWWLRELAQAAQIPEVTLYQWARRGWVSARQQQGRWIVWADEEELDRLRQLHQLPRGYHTRRLWLEEERVQGRNEQ